MQPQPVTLGGTMSRETATVFRHRILPGKQQGTVALIWGVTWLPSPPWLFRLSCLIFRMRLMSGLEEMIWLPLKPLPGSMETTGSMTTGTPTNPTIWLTKTVSRWRRLLEDGTMSNVQASSCSLVRNLMLGPSASAILEETNSHPLLLILIEFLKDLQTWKFVTQI